MPLTPAGADALIGALLSAFDLPTLRQMVRENFNLDLEAITSATELPDVVASLVQVADAEGWLVQLISAARNTYPHDPQLQAAAARLGLAPSLVAAVRPNPFRHRAYSDSSLEKIITGTNSLLDIAEWRSRLSEIEFQVCRLEIASQPVGTGFLIGPDLLMTCYHVVETLLHGADSPKDLLARFDFKITRRQVVANPGRTFLLDSDWLYDFSPYDPAEVQDPNHACPSTEELDYAILRLANKPGNQPVSEQSIEDRPRGWVSLTDRVYSFPTGSPLFIVQHPEGAPLKLAMDTEAILGFNANQTRVRYRTNTEKGASGSPCFNNQWQLVALHHSGIVEFNEGIPTHLIATLLKQRGKWPLPGSSSPS